MAPRLHQPSEVLLETRCVIAHAAELGAAVKLAAERNRGPGEAIADIAPLQDAHLTAMGLLPGNQVLMHAPQHEEVARLPIGDEVGPPAVSAQAFVEGRWPLIRAEAPTNERNCAL